jgi:HEAT repeat protein
MNDDLVQALIEAVVAGDDEAAERACRACAGRADLVPALRPLLADGNADRRWWAVRALSIVGGPDAAVLAIERLDDGEEAVRCAAALVLGTLGAEPAVPRLIASLGDASGWVRDSAADALALIGAPALPALVAAMDDNRQPVRVRVSAALRKIIIASLVGLTLNDIPPTFHPALTALYRALNDPNGVVRQNAFEGLDRLGLFDQVYFSP